MSADEITVTLPGGTVIGRLESWVTTDEVFDGLLSDGSGGETRVSEGVSQDRAKLGVVRSWLVREIEAQQADDQSSPDGVKRNLLIREGFQMQKSLTEEIIRKEEEAA